MAIWHLSCGRKTGWYAIMFNLGFGNNFRSNFGQQRQQPFDFKALDTRLGKMETGIASLTDQFRDLVPGPSPLEVEPTPAGIESLAAPQPAAPAPQDTGFAYDPEGGSLMSQLSSAYGGQTHEEWGGGRGQPGFTQEFADFFTGEGYYADPTGTFVDGGWNISDKPINLGIRGGTLDPYGNMQPQDVGWGPQQLQGVEDYGATKPQMNPMQQQVQPQIGAGLTGLAAYQSQNKGMV